MNDTAFVKAIDERLKGFLLLICGVCVITYKLISVWQSLHSDFYFNETDLKGIIISVITLKK